MDFKKIFTTTFWMNIFGITSFLLALFFICQIALRIYTRHGQSVEVPNVVGMSYNDARRALDKRDLEFLVVDSDYVKAKPAGEILDQQPNSGVRVKEGRTIYLTINSASSPTRVMPDLADNSSKRAAMVKLTAMGFKLTADESIEGEQDWVYAIKYNGKKVYAGDRIPSDATLTLVVGSGSNDDDESGLSVDEQGSYSEELDEDTELDADVTEPTKTTTSTKAATSTKTKTTTSTKDAATKAATPAKKDAAKKTDTKKTTKKSDDWF